MNKRRKLMFVLSAGVLLPTFIIIGLCAIPYIDRDPSTSGFYSFKKRRFAKAAASLSPGVPAPTGWVAPDRSGLPGRHRM